ncbi:hypothetical protein, partial [Streptomyces brasiliscabiei]|uniref:hypothetical protein n=1 Tax=Streptomyces brasiliscabiei TaxID=2736302 RepID=UPI003014A4D1
ALRFIKNLLLYFRRYDKNAAEIARHFYHDKFALQTCLYTASSHFITKKLKKSRIKFKLYS